MELTGRKVFAITASAFAVIIAVNFTMAFLAVGTFPGLEVKNSYVASQQFERNRQAQLALGWTVEAAIEGGLLTVAITDRSNAPVEVAQISGILGRATHVGDDVVPEFALSRGVYSAPVDLTSGYWNLRLSAVAADGTEFRQRIEIKARN